LNSPWGGTTGSYLLVQKKLCWDKHISVNQSQGEGDAGRNKGPVYSPFLLFRARDRAQGCKIQRGGVFYRAKPAAGGRIKRSTGEERGGTRRRKREIVFGRENFVHERSHKDSDRNDDFRGVLKKREVKEKLRPQRREREVRTESKGWARLYPDT